MEQDRILREPIRFESSDGATELRGLIWRDEALAAPKGIVQVAHGMAEHIARYDGFARFLARAGYLVCGYDQIGHGASCEPARYGKLPATDGAEILMEDQHRMRARVRGRFAGIPHFMFGHSLGSYIMRAYIARHGQGLSGCILCGTGHVAPGVSRAGHALSLVICQKDGEDTCSPFLDGLGAGGYNRGIAHARTDFDWLSHDAENVDRYIADPACGFMFSAGGYATVTALTGEVCSKRSFARIPKGLPLLFVAGEEDPVGSCGKGVRKASAMARDAGVVDVTTRIYPHMRHEILNETGHADVYADVLAWLEGHLR